jgi:hypothetical protein
MEKMEVFIIKKVMDKVLKGIALLLFLIAISKFVIWLKTDEPISRLSILYIAAIIALLMYRKKWTFISLLVLLTLPFIGDFYSANYSSGLSPFNFTGSIYSWLSSIGSNWNYSVMLFPRYFSVILVILLLLPASRTLYGFGKK